jgi:hypothetical protein
MLDYSSIIMPEDPIPTQAFQKDISGIPLGSIPIEQLEQIAITEMVLPVGFHEHFLYVATDACIKDMVGQDKRSLSQSPSTARTHSV